MEQKFVITDEGYLRLGYVRMHEDLLEDDDTCIGGGYWEVDYIRMELILDRESYDYGKPKWHYLEQLYVPEDYRGLKIVYHGDSLMDSVNVSEELTIYYV